MYSTSKSERQRFSRSLWAGMLFEHRPYFLACAPLPHHSLFAQGLSPRHKDHSLQQCKHTPNSVQTSLFKQRQKINKETTTKKTNPASSTFCCYAPVLVQDAHPLCGAEAPGRSEAGTMPARVPSCRCHSEPGKRGRAAHGSTLDRATPRTAQPRCSAIAYDTRCTAVAFACGKQPPWGTNDSLRGPSAGSRHAQPRGGDGLQEAADGGGKRRLRATTIAALLRESGAASGARRIWAEVAPPHRLLAGRRHAERRLAGCWEPKCRLVQAGIPPRASHSGWNPSIAPDS